MYSLEVRESVDRIFSKLAMQHLRRVHIDKSFVLIYSVDEQNEIVIIEDYDHHDNVYI